MPSPKYTVRLPETLHAIVQEHMLSTRTPFAVLIREALSAYLAHPAPTPGAPLVPTPADTLRELQVQVAAVTTRVDILEQRQPPVPIAADSADTLHEIQGQLAALTARVEILELALTAVPTPRRQNAATTPIETSAPAAAVPPSRRQRRRQPHGNSAAIHTQTVEEQDAIEGVDSAQGGPDLRTFPMMERGTAMRDQ